MASEPIAGRGLRGSTPPPAVASRSETSPSETARAVVAGADIRELIETLRRSPGARLALDAWRVLLGGLEKEDGPDPDSVASEALVSDMELRGLADRLRASLHPDGVVTYVIDRNVNYSNVCTCVCNFCAFYRPPGHDEGYVHTHEEIFRRVEETIELGGSGVLMQGGLHPDLPLEWYTTLLSELKRRYSIHLHCFSPTEILGLGEVTGLSWREILETLMAAGLDSMPGGGGEILVDEIRRKRRSKVNSAEWLEIMEIAHELGLPTTATMMFGHGESLDDRLVHLDKLRALQDRTGGFVSFIPWNFQPDNTPLGRAYPQRVEGKQYLRWLALTRLFLNNIKNVQVSWLTQGLDVGKLGLRSGANDMGSTMIEENVIRPAGARHEATDAVLRRAIVEAGFRPVLRNGAYVRLEEPSGSPSP